MYTVKQIIFIQGGRPRLNIRELREVLEARAHHRR